MRPGALDRRITLQKLERGYSNSGQPIEEWHDVAEVWAGFEQQSGREFFSGQITLSERRVVFRLRWLEGITVLHRVLYPASEEENVQEPDTAHLFDIHAVREIGRRKGLELHCSGVG